MKQGNSNSDEFVPINFQPMPKRFMVWDKINKKFLPEPLDIWRIALLFGDRPVDISTPPVDNSRFPKYILCQSTNLFDQNGKEIFEGSILEQDLTNSRANRKYHYLVQSVPYWGAGWMPVPIDGGKSWPALVPNTAKCLKNVGHILSNPELVEEKCVSTAKK